MSSTDQPISAEFLIQACHLVQLEMGYNVDARHLSEALNKGEFDSKDLIRAIECLFLNDGSVEQSSDEVKQVLNHLISNSYSPESLEQILNVLDVRGRLFIFLNESEVNLIIDSFRVQARSIIAGNKKTIPTKRNNRTVDFSPYLLSLKLSDYTQFSADIQNFFTLNGVTTFKHLLICFRKRKLTGEAGKNFNEEISNFLNHFGLSAKILREINMTTLEDEYNPLSQTEVVADTTIPRTWLEGFEEARRVESLRQQVEVRRLEAEAQEARRRADIQAILKAISAKRGWLELDRMVTGKRGG